MRESKMKKKSKTINTLLLSFTLLISSFLVMPLNIHAEEEEVTESSEEIITHSETPPSKMPSS